MGRSPVTINPKTGERLKDWIREIGITQEAFAKRSHMTQQHLSNIVNGKKALTIDRAKQISDKIRNENGERIRVEYLLGLDDFKTEHKRIESYFSHTHTEQDLIEKLIELHGYTIETELQDGGLDENGNPYQTSYIAIRSPGKETRLLRQEDYSQLRKRISDYIEGQLLLMFHFPKDMAREYGGGYFNG